ncbi:MAG: SusC/RagA family TonB-linked outer membrane protein, partial [Bacteroidota bacterium]
MKLLLLLAATMLQGAVLHAQQTVTGSVTEASSGEQLTGATVILKGTTTGTVTNADGNYSLSVPSLQDTLVFSFVGYETQEVPIDGRTEININLQESEVMLSETVVIGYGTVQKSDLTGSVAVVSSEELNRIPASNFTRALQGRASGVMVSQSGSPGSSAQIRVRGIGSINQNPNPIYVIDGVITGGLGNVNPTDIETVQVLKDASAAAIYGADGANGVVIITTKRGKQGAPKVSLSSYVSINRVPDQFEVMNANEYSDFYSNLLEENNVAVPTAYTDHFRQWYYGEGWQEGTQWQEEVVRTGLAQNHYVRFSGGGEGSNYSISLNNSDEKGILLASSAKRYSLRVNSDFEIGKYIKIGESISLRRNISQNPTTYQGNPWQVTLITSPLMRMYNENNKGGFEGPQVSYEYTNPDGETEIVSNTGYNDKPNPRGPMEIGDNYSYNNNVLASLYMEIKPLKWLTYKLTPAVEGSFNRSKFWFPA